MAQTTKLQIAMANAQKAANRELSAMTVWRGNEPAWQRAKNGDQQRRLWFATVYPVTPVLYTFR